MMPEGFSFEDAIKQLEKITADLERETTNLHDSLALYEEGVKLVNQCNEALEDAERKVKILTVNGNGEPQETDFSEKKNG